MQLYGRGLRRRLPTMLDGDERRAPHGVLAGVLAARARRCCSTARRSAWARTSRSRAAQRPHADAVVAGAQRRVLDRRGAAPPARPSPGRARAGQRRRASAATPVAAELVRAPHPPPPECPELGFGRGVLDTGAPSVFAHRCDWDGSTIVAVHELAGQGDQKGHAAPRRGRRGPRRPVRRGRASGSTATGAPPSSSGATATGGSGCGGPVSAIAP